MSQHIGCRYQIHRKNKMDKEIIIYFGMDLGDVDKTAYGIYDPETGKFQEISEEEYSKLMEIEYEIE